jgi:hypothetical protein
MRQLGGDRLEAEIRCLACGDSLYFLPDSYPLVFHCEGGHFLTIRDLLDEALPAGRAPLPDALTHWGHKAQVLHQLAARSLERGQILVAADFQETAGRIDQWIQQLRALLPHGAAPSPAPEPPSEREGGIPSRG